MVRKSVAAAKPSKSLTDIESQIEALKQQVRGLEEEAQAIRNSERNEVIDKIKAAIAQYDLTAEQLGLKRGAKALKAPKATKAGKGVVKFRDAQGNTWAGMGKRPDWLRQALAAGATLDSFRV